MPTYEYVCVDCGTHVDEFQRISEDPLTTCGACGGRLRKVFHPAGILFKGSGFYRTDSRTDSRSSKPSSSDSATGGESKKASPGGDKKEPSGETKGKSA